MPSCTDSSDICCEALSANSSSLALLTVSVEGWASSSSASDISSVYWTNGSSVMVESLSTASSWLMTISVLWLVVRWNICCMIISSGVFQFLNFMANGSFGRNWWSLKHFSWSRSYRLRWSVLHRSPCAGCIGYIGELYSGMTIFLQLKWCNRAKSGAWCITDVLRYWVSLSQ